MHAGHYLRLVRLHYSTFRESTATEILQRRMPTTGANRAASRDKPLSSLGSWVLQHLSVPNVCFQFFHLKRGRETWGHGLGDPVDKVGVVFIFAKLRETLTTHRYTNLVDRS